MSAAGGPPVAALVAFLAFVLVQRLLELGLSRRNERRLIARGAVESGRRHFPLFVALHLLWPAALVAEVLAWGARPGAAWSTWLALFVAAQALRAAAVRALGERWVVRVIVPPGEAPIRSGPYRWLRHPNYLAVVLELASGPMMFGAWRTALAATLLNLAVLAVRVPLEERALGIRPGRT